jgi:hypothetical protein
MQQTSTLDIIRFDEAGERLSWKKLQAGSTTMTAPLQIHGRFSVGDEVWCSRLVYNDGMILLQVARPPDFDPDGDLLEPDRGPVFLLYPSEEAAQLAGWRH